MFDVGAFIEVTRTDFLRDNNGSAKLSDWQTDQIERLARCDNEETLLRRLAEVAVELGFEFFAFGIRSPLPLTRPRVVVHNNYPAEWQRRYVEQGYLSVDPSIIKALRSSLPVIWSETLFAENIRLWEEARECRLKFGCAPPRGCWPVAIGGPCRRCSRCCKTGRSTWPGKRRNCCTTWPATKRRLRPSERGRKRLDWRAKQRIEDPSAAQYWTALTVM